MSSWKPRVNTERRRLTRAAKLELHCCESVLHCCESVLHCCESVLHCCESVLHCCESVLHCCESVLHCCESVLHCCESVLHCCESVLHCCESVLHYCESVLHCCESVLHCCESVLHCCESVLHCCESVLHCCESMLHCWESTQMTCGRSVRTPGDCSGETCSLSEDQQLRRQQVVPSAARHGHWPGEPAILPPAVRAVRVADQTCHLTQSRYTDTEPTSPTCCQAPDRVATGFFTLS